jgi:hypothetical protein
VSECVSELRENKVQHGGRERGRIMSIILSF